jgi:hypothetical protein
MKGGARKSFAFPATELLLVRGQVSRPVDVIRLLAANSLSLKQAHAAMDQLAETGRVFVEVRTYTPKTLALELSRLGVTTYGGLSSLSSIGLSSRPAQANFTISYAYA